MIENRRSTGNKCVASMATMAIVLFVASRALAQSYFGAAVCQDAGWNYVPYRADSRRFPLDASSVINPQPGGPNYVNNLDYSWQMWFSANVQAVVFGFSRFDLNSNDLLELTGKNTLTLSGHTDSSATNPFMTDVVYPIDTGCGGSDGDNYVTLRFATDSSGTGTGWAMRGVWVRCDLAPPKPNASRACRSDPNIEHDGILISQGDAAFFKAPLPAGYGMLINLKPDGPVDDEGGQQNFDLWASDAFSYPHPLNGFKWFSNRTYSVDENGRQQMAEEFIFVKPKKRNGRVVSIGVTSTSGSGGYRLYYNLIPESAMFTFTAGTDFSYRSARVCQPYPGRPCGGDDDCPGTCAPGNLNAGASCYPPGSGGGCDLSSNGDGQGTCNPVGGTCGSQKYDFSEQLHSILRSLAGGLYQATDGTALVTKWYLHDNVGSAMNCGVRGARHGGPASCHVRFWKRVETCGGTDVCVRAGSCNFTNQFEGVNDCRWTDVLTGPPSGEGLGLTHEFGHCLYSFSDEYNRVPTCAGFPNIRCDQPPNPCSSPENCYAFGWLDGHTVMNGPQGELNVNDYCTDLTHLKDGWLPGLFEATKPTSNWADIKKCFPQQVALYYSTLTPDPERWVDSDIWGTLTTIVDVRAKKGGAPAPIYTPVPVPTPSGMAPTPEQPPCGAVPGHCDGSCPGLGSTCTSVGSYCICAAAPTCTRGTACGSCGTGFCVDHCNGSAAIGELCVTSTVGPHCSSDADCTPNMPYCISNGFCGGPGNAATCRALCSGSCGNGICDPGENASNCPADCPPVCGNGVCEPGEACDFGTCGSCCCSDCGCGNCGGTCTGSTPASAVCHVG